LGQPLGVQITSIPFFFNLHIIIIILVKKIYKSKFYNYILYKFLIKIIKMLSLLLIVPILGIILLLPLNDTLKLDKQKIKQIALFTSLLNLLISIYIWLLFDSNSMQYQFVYEFAELSFCHFHVGIDGLSIYFVLLTTFITPLCIISN
jgi:NADH:ubiquinone oxidoreductase subunit 4 (subunit M)